MPRSINLARGKFISIFPFRYYFKMADRQREEGVRSALWRTWKLTASDPRILL
jgi:hypothetical protein